MDIENKKLEDKCSEFSNYFSSYYDWSEVDLTFFCVDIENKKINITSNNYEWQLTCWDDDLDLLIEQRLKLSIQYWNNYSNEFMKTLMKVNKHRFKIDICNRYNNIFEMVTVNTNKHLSFSNILSIYKHRPIISEFAHQQWKKTPEITLPLRATISPDAELLGNSTQGPTSLLEAPKFMRFGDIRLTRKEMITIRMLISGCRVKEISYMQGCSEAAEHCRINNIKQKLGCEHQSTRYLFNALKEHGVTLACLETFIDLPTSDIQL